MKNILEMSINEMSNLDFECKCGKRHSLPIKEICIKNNALDELNRVLSTFKDKKIFIFSDENTYNAAGEKTVKILKNNNHTFKNFIIPNSKEILIPNEKVLGRLFMELENDTELIIAIGSGTINDLGKYLSVKTKIPYIIICTAPSMDGYASDGSPLICDGYKISFEATLPYAIIGDVNIMKNAPDELIRAGFGDIVGKITALMDWKLSNILTGEYICETCITLTERAIQRVIDSADKLMNRDEKSVQYLLEALTFTGVAMGLVGVSRPASGAEHMISHYWEMDFIKRNKYPYLHGIKVGIATPIVLELFELMKEELPKEVFKYKYDKKDVIKLLKAVGAPTLPSEIEIDRDLFYKSMIGAYKVRNRYSIFEYAVKRGKIDEYSKIITEKIYG
ncbi:sn-glycerol-1-phosphate dehydrogenase [Anaerofustis stercorihominis]|uniref:3-dehydroquinate synthase n=1 Tax=Anaerofustis stercorihominis DSM 17244 TaxID=445971 RepID=B1CAM6_9FIRM|nr:sn-glycerol-1-phosphate dehydrogenase [Anaerofustis stercorihominis]EDS72499.1 3-dehydroquinate synthase [Anaerofustis stercorihominis DSM 17244]MCQ4795262.1 sn-glycerol-1-phosphate dehydrogenase [Anaerofustis stercorihominis]